jgi:hypothetical protein
MRACIIGVLAAAVIAPSASAQVVKSESAAASPPAEYLIPPPLPAGGCIWENAVFSNGAIFERYLGRPFYFRCVNGQWQSFYSFHQARTGRSEQPLLDPPQRPTPLR